MILAGGSVSNRTPGGLLEVGSVDGGDAGGHRSRFTRVRWAWRGCGERECGERVWRSVLQAGGGDRGAIYLPEAPDDVGDQFYPAPLADKHRLQIVKAWVGTEKNRKNIL